MINHFSAIMAKDFNNSVDQNLSHINEDDTEKSLVGKFKSIISNTPLSKWFRKQDDNIRSIIRRREEEFDEDINQMLPPAKRARFPNDYKEHNFSNIITNHSIEKTVISEKLVNKTHNHFPEPVAGPSGIQSRKLLNSVNIPTNSAKNVFSNDLLNGLKDSDSEESTSGYSSAARIGSKEQVSHSEPSSNHPSPLQTNLPNSRSLFQSPVASSSHSLYADRMTSPNLNTSLSSRRPCFNTSSFGSPSFTDKTASTERIINSPFYNGTTIYGGASAYGSKLGRSAKDLRTSLKRSVHIKPINKAKDRGSLTLGKTARKILETLEQYSTPVNDAKKIPVSSKRFRADTSLLGKHIGVSPHVAKNSPLNNELQVPTVSDLLKMKQKAKLQSSTEAVRQIAISSFSELNTVSPPVHVSDKNQKSPEKSVEVEKSKEKSKDIVQKEKPKMPSLSTSSMPKFDLNVPPKKTPEKSISVIEKTTNLPASKPQIIQESRTISETNKTPQRDLPIVNPQFRFSNPLIIAENLKSIVAMNNFKFSEPLTNMTKVDSSLFTSTPLAKAIKGKNNGQNIIKDVLSNSSLMDKFKPAAGTWECSGCLIRNQPEKSKCIACEAPNPKSTPVQPETNKAAKTTMTSFGDKFKMPEDKWECPVCMIRNSNDSAKCVACETVNPKSTTLVSSSSSLGFQNKFQHPANTWECSTCLIRNKEEVSKCVACETPRIAKPSISNPPAPSGFLNKFQPSTDTWECPTCLIRNKEELSKCAACVTSRSTKPSGFNLSTFKTKVDEWDCPVCLVKNKITHAKCQCCEAIRPGASSNVIVKDTEKKSPPKFNFGIDQKTAASFSFGVPPSATAPTLPKASVEPAAAFGDAKINITSAPTNNTLSTPPTFSFGVTPKAQEKEKPIEVVKPAENKTALLTLPPSTVVVKPVVPIVPEKTEVNANLFKSPPTSKTAVPLSGSSSIKPAEPSNAKPSFSFGAKFDSKDKDTSFVSPLPKFDFSKPTNSAGPTLAATAIKQPAQAIASTPVFTFGGPNKQAPPSDPSLFGQKKLPTVNNGLDVKVSLPFGTVSNTSLNSIPAKPLETKQFSFTKPDSGEPASKTPMFNFGQSAGSAANPVAIQTPGFNFTQVSKAPVFNFSANKSENTMGSTTGNIFSGSNTGTSKNGVFNFGGPSQNSASQKAGFNFGTPAAPSSTGFNFGAGMTTSAVPAAPSGGFNFAGNAKPSFNFSESSVPVTFTAPPAADGAPRKIKRAVRRAR